MRTLWLAGGLAGWLAACGGSGTSISVDVTFATSVSAVEGAVYDNFGAVRDHVPLGNQPGRLVVLLPDRARAVRVVVRGQSASGTAFGVVSRSLGAGEALHLSMVVADGVGDGDGDGVPDSVDDCPSVADAAQANARGGGSGDACAGGDDQGALVDMTAPPPDLAPIVLVGRSSVAGAGDYTDGSIAVAYRFTAQASGTATHLSILVDTANTASTASFAVYSGDASGPMTRQSLSTASALTLGWTTVSMPAVNIVAGTDYWIAWAVPSTDSGTFWFRNECSLPTNDEAVSSPSGLPASWPVQSLNPCGQTSVYLSP